MGIGELQAAWEERSEAIRAEDEAWDARRTAAAPKYRQALDAFLADEIEVGEFRSRIDSLSKSEPHWGFRGMSQMFFNQLVKAADPAELTAALKAALPAPANRPEARTKLAVFQAAVEAARDRAVATGVTKPGTGRVDSFVSFFWELQDRERWPMFFPNSRDVLDNHEILDVHQEQPELYIAFLEAMDMLRETLGADNWGVEHLLWQLGKGSEDKDGDGEGTAAPAAEAAGPDLYGRYREQGLYFPDEVVTALVLSLATKRFAILSGISGTGKTQIALGLARYLQTASSPPQPQSPPEAPADDAAGVHVRLTAPKIKRGHVSLIRDGLRFFGQALELPERGSSSFYRTRLPDGSTTKMRLNNIDFSDGNRELYRLYLLQEASEWLRAEAKPGDYLRLRLRPEDEVDVALDLIARGTVDRDESPDRFAVIPVRSNWTDPRGLVGYFNPLTRTYVRTDLIELLLRAGDDPDNPYILILDEMNLARVEYYFSDFLSTLESGADLQLMAPGVEEESAASDVGEEKIEVPGELAIPPNVSFVGTVNVDETTHSFSPKVLDRANVIEFSEVDVERALGHGGEPPTGGLRLREGSLSPAWLCTPREEALRPKAVAHDWTEFVSAVEDVHAILLEYGRPFGYRVIDEISAFVGHAIEKAEGEKEEIVRRAFDLQLQQKILPKLSGGRELMPPLQALLDYCLEGERGADVDPEAVRRAAAERLRPGAAEPPQYPGATGKIQRMLNRLDQTGFVGALE